MRIGVNALYLVPGGVGGSEIFLRNVLAELAKIDRINQYVVFTNRETSDLVPASANFSCAQQNVHAGNRPARILWEQLVLPRRLTGIDVLLNGGFTAPLSLKVPQVTVIYDMQYKRRPEFYKPVDLLFWRLLVGAAVRRSQALITISEDGKRDIERFFGKTARVAPLGAEQRFFDMVWTPNSGEPYILCVSTLHPHKNLELLIRAYSRFQGNFPQMKLVIAGMRGFHAEVIERLVADLRLRESVRLTGWIPREAIYRLYEGASSFVFPSLFEGFGIPLVEALAAGIPSICSDVEPMKSNASDAALRFAPHSELELVSCLERVTADAALRARLHAAGPLQASQFRWVRTAEVVLDTLTNAAGLRAES